MKNTTDRFTRQRSEDNRKNIWSLSQQIHLANATIANPNLLLNGNFLINQRASSVYTSTSSCSYTVDRWCLGNLAGVFSCITSNGQPYFTCKSERDGEFVFGQIIDHATYYANKKLTFSLKYQGLYGGEIQIAIGDGTGYTYSATKKAESGILTVTKTISASPSRISVWVVKKGTGTSWSVTPLEAKLESGEYATPFVIRSYDEELTLCQKYYLYLQDYWGRHARYNDNQLSLNLHIGMRSTPTFSCSSYYIQNYASGSSTVTTYRSGFTFEVVSTNPWVTRIFAKKANHGVYDGIYYFYKLVFDAELY